MVSFITFIEVSSYSKLLSTKIRTFHSLGQLENCEMVNLSV